MTADELPKQTSCQGYVIKKGKLVSSWRRRYVDLDGETMRLTSYKSKTAMEQHEDVDKAMVFNNVERCEDPGSLLNSTPQPYGVKFVGHHAGQHKGYAELRIYLGSAQDQTKWLQVAKNAIEMKANPGKGLSMEERRKALLGPSKAVAAQNKKLNSVGSTQEQIQQHKETTKDLIHHALQDVTEANKVGSDACAELSEQNEILHRAERDLDDADKILDEGDALLKKMKNPLMHLMPTNHAHDSKQKHKHGHHKDTHEATEENGDENPSERQVGPQVQVSEDDELSMLSSALTDLQAQAEEIGVVAEEENHTIDRITDKADRVNHRLKEQTKKAKTITKNGTVW